MNRIRLVLIGTWERKVPLDLRGAALGSHGPVTAKWGSVLQATFLTGGRFERKDWAPRGIVPGLRHLPYTWLTLVLSLAPPRVVQAPSKVIPLGPVR